MTCNGSIESLDCDGDGEIKYAAIEEANPPTEPETDEAITRLSPGGWGMRRYSETEA